MRALVGLGVDPARTTLFCTHAHIDHTGLARELSEAGARVLVPEGVLADMRRFAVPAWRDGMVARMRAEGVGDVEAAELADAIWDHVLNFESEGIGFSRRGRGRRGPLRPLVVRGRPASGRHRRAVRGSGSPRARVAFSATRALPLLDVHRLLGRGGRTP